MATIQSLETLFVNLVKVVVALSGVALFVMLIVGGFTFLFSGGDNKQLGASPRDGDKRHNRPRRHSECISYPSCDPGVYGRRCHKI